MGGGVFHDPGTSGSHCRSSFHSHQHHKEESEIRVDMRECAANPTGHQRSDGLK